MNLVALDPRDLSDSGVFVDTDCCDFKLVPKRVDVWTVPLRPTPRIIGDLTAILSADERERVFRFHAEEHRHGFIAGRGILRTILSIYLSTPPESFLFRIAAKGKPYLENNRELHFNLAHSGGRAVYAIGDSELGVDIESIKTTANWEQISKRFFSAQEFEQLMRLEPKQQVAGFFACWTRKEAYIKATGEGMSEGLDRFYAGVNPEQSQGPIERPGESPSRYFRNLDLGSQHAGALVTKYADCKVRRFDFETIERCLDFGEQKRNTLPSG